MERTKPFTFGRLIAGLVATTVLAAACSTSAPPQNAESDAPPTQEPSPTRTPHPLAVPSPDGRFAVDNDGRELAITCWGSEGPTIVLEGGDASGLDQWSRSALVRELVEVTRVCAYDRAGGEGSDPAPNEPRDADDLADDLHALLNEAQVAAPYVMVGNSFGGMVAAYYAVRFPSDVVGVVVLDSPAPSAEMTLEDFPEGVWDYPGNVERLDTLTEFEHRFALNPEPFEAPLILISATGGQSSVEDQGEYWLPLSPDARQVELAGGHDIHEDQPVAVAREVLSLVEEAR